jgi:hypothetical protein
MTMNVVDIVDLIVDGVDGLRDESTAGAAAGGLQVGTTVDAVVDGPEDGTTVGAAVDGL